MECTEIKQVVERSGGIIIGVIITVLSVLLLLILIAVIIVVMGFRRIERNIVCCGCLQYCGFCCCCGAAVGKEDDDDELYLIPSWTGVEEAEEKEVQAELEVEGASVIDSRDLQVVETTFVKNSYTLIINENTECPEYVVSEAVQVKTETVVDVCDKEVKSTGTYKYVNEANSFSFAQVLLVSRFEQKRNIQISETSAILKMEEDFFQEQSYFSILLVERLGNRIVVENRATQEWKDKLMDAYKKSLLAMTGKNRLQTFDGGPNSTESSLNSIMLMKLLEDNLHVSLEKAKISTTEINEHITKIKGNLGKFDEALSVIYLQNVQKLRNILNLKEKLINKLTEDQLMNEIDVLRKKHVKSLSISAQDRLSRDIDEIWASMIKDYDKALDENKSIFCDKLSEDVPYKEKYEMEMKRKREDVINEEDVINYYCNILQEELNQKHIWNCDEVAKAATKFQSLQKKLRSKHLNFAIKRENQMYNGVTEGGNNLVSPSLLKLIATHQTDLKNLRVSLRMNQKKLDQEIITIIEDMYSSSSLCGVALFEMKGLVIDRGFLENLLELQLDLSVAEHEILRSIVVPQLKVFEVHFELRKLEQERRLQSSIEEKRMEIANEKEAKLVGDWTSDGMIRSAIEIRDREEKVESDHRKLIAATGEKLSGDLEAAKMRIESFFHQEVENIRRNNEMKIGIVHKQDEVIFKLKKKLLERAPEARERILTEHQINNKALEEDLLKIKMHQEQVLQQKIQARKLEKKLEREKTVKQLLPPSMTPYRPGSASEFAANCLVAMLLEVRHKRNIKELNTFHDAEGEKLKSKMERRYYINSKLGLQLHEMEMVVKLASSLNMSREDIKKELGDLGRDHGDKETSLLLTQNVLGVYDHTS